MYSIAQVWLGTLVTDLRDRVATAGRDEEGQGLVEYALILALVSIAAIAVMGLLGTDIIAKFNEVRGAL